MNAWAVAFVLCAGCFLLSRAACPRKEWSRLILTQHWPETFCTIEHCKTNFNYWTVHGLWPNSGNMCNTSWHFNASLIEDIIPEMEKFWPDLLMPSSQKFWEYEWRKHGTCAAKAESLNTQHKYFSKALELYHKYNLHSVLKSNKIVPSQELYKLDVVETAIASVFGAKPKIQCIHPGKGGQIQTLGQIEICVDRDFQLIACEKSFEETWSNEIPSQSASGHSELSVCDPSMPIYYPPVDSRAEGWSN